MPYPKPYETRKEYIKRAIKYFMDKEGLGLKEATGRAFGFWKNYRKDRK